MSATNDNAQGTIAWASGVFVGAGIPAALTTTGTTQVIAALFALAGFAGTIIRAYLRAQ